MKYICSVCGFVYDEEMGCPEEEIKKRHEKWLKENPGIMDELT